MDLPIHDQILWHACVLASQRLGADKIGDPLEYFPILVRGSWINDTNQVTAFTDYFTKGAPNGTPLVTIDDGVRTVFRTYWEMQLESVLGRVKQFDSGLAERCRANVAELTHVADFGSYACHDHLDVLEDEPEKEYVKTGDHALAKTVSASRKFIETRLGHSTLDAPSKAGRLDGVNVSALGRALHSIADFFAHTNFVELLLWELATQSELDDGLVDYFNRSPRAYPFEPHLEEGFYTPLPRRPEEWPANHPLLCGMWYGQTPAATPLVSCVFDAQDTAFSLLHLYANHLERTRAESSEGEINLVFSILDVSGMPIPLQLIRSIVTMVDAVKDVLDAAGRAARGFLADVLVKNAQASTDNPTARALFATAGSLIKAYDSKGAAEWARAGRLRYVAQALSTDLGQRLRKRTLEKKSSLPHHTILSKDHPPHQIDDRVRYNLACFLATELSAEVLEWHFGPTARDDFYPAFKSRYLIHPSKLLQSFDPAKMGALVESFYRGGWQGRLDKSTTLEAWRKQ